MWNPEKFVSVWLKSLLWKKSFWKTKDMNEKTYIGSVDKVSTKSFWRKETRKTKYDEFKRRASSIQSTSSDPVFFWSSSSSFVAASDEDENAILRIKITTPRTMKYSVTEISSVISAGGKTFKIESTLPHSGGRTVRQIRYWGFFICFVVQRQEMDSFARG